MIMIHVHDHLLCARSNRFEIKTVGEWAKERARQRIAEMVFSPPEIDLKSTINDGESQKRNNPTIIII